MYWELAPIHARTAECLRLRELNSGYPEVVRVFRGRRALPSEAEVILKKRDGWLRHGFVDLVDFEPDECFI
jgi:hypothetical protein